MKEPRVKLTTTFTLKISYKIIYNNNNNYDEESLTHYFTIDIAV